MFIYRKHNATLNTEQNYHLNNCFAATAHLRHTRKCETCIPSGIPTSTSPEEERRKRRATKPGSSRGLVQNYKDDTVTKRFLTNSQASWFLPWGVPSTGVGVFFLLLH